MSSIQANNRSIELSHEDKLLFPDDGITKRHLAEYYRDIAETMLPHLRDRAITMQRLPDGIDGKTFYHKDAPDYFPEWIRTSELKKEGGTVNHVIADDAATLVYLANQACITPHTWLSRVDEPDQPDLLVFDLDPSGGDFKGLRRAAMMTRELFDEAGLAPFVKTTGSRGLHVVSPLRRGPDFDEVRQLARDLAEILVGRDPELFTTEQRKNKRGNRIFLDTLRNAWGQTVTPPYAVRPKPGAPVATPLEWDEVDADDISQRHTLKSIFRRLSQKDCPWKDIRRHARSIKSARDFTAGH
ncbi:non-homologous end-joining DNA ligase [Haloferula sargassicola]|uniref:Bifunctional non-homologous end joining protein LigD n=1 Tax=Haloferula sargassicola TaxID=490096 RepID=A0ABP9UKG8_9BACT